MSGDGRWQSRKAQLRVGSSMITASLLKDVKEGRTILR